MAGRFVPLIAALLLSPLLLGLINRVKALFAGRHGQPLLQTYYDIIRCLRKGAVYSRTTTWVFRLAPAAGLAAALVAVAIVPLGLAGSALAFPGDLVLFAYCLGLMRFLTVTAALDTGSAFGGMGASREVAFSAHAEPALLVSLAAVARVTGLTSLAEMVAAVSPQAWLSAAPSLALVVAALFVVVLAENARVPVDDPNTHLELTMIHEVMVLDHSGPDFAFTQYAASLKLWALSALLVGVAVPIRTGVLVIDLASCVAGIFAVALVIGVVESSMARLRLVRVPQLLVGAGAFAALALILTLR
jgi:formate hydrogenlyase subunit 4